MGDELLGIVIDYKKTRARRLDLGAVYHGLSLQLLGYLMALAECGETLTGRPVRPIAALYVGLTPAYRTVDHPGFTESRAAPAEGTDRPRGLLIADDLDALDHTASFGWSDHYNVYRKKDGQLGHEDRSDAIDRPSFQSLMQHVRYQLGQLADGVLDGRMAVNPYRLGSFSPCSWCTMASVCRFEMGISDTRFLETLRRSEVFRRLADRANDDVVGNIGEAPAGAGDPT